MSARLARALALAGLALAWGWSAGAHALLVRSIPAANARWTVAPASIELWFSEPLEPDFSDARLLDSNGRQFVTGAASIDINDAHHLSLPIGALGPGVYTVAWQTLSQIDGHEWLGSFTFTILNPDGSTPAGAPAAGTEAGSDVPSPLEAAVRWLALAGTLLLVGLPLFDRLAVNPPRQAAELDGDGYLRRWPVVFDRLMALGAGLVLVGTWTELGLQSLTLGRLDLLAALALRTRTGALALVRQSGALTVLLLVVSRGMHPSAPDRKRTLSVGTLLALLGSAAGLVAAADSGHGPLAILGGATIGASLALEGRGRDPQHPSAAATVRTLPRLLPGLALALSFSLGSHAAASPGVVWGVGADWLHLLAAGVWASGLLGLALLTSSQGNLSPSGRLDLAGVIQRFSWLASLSVFLLGASGLLSAGVQLTAPSDLWMTTYGRTLSLKLMLFGAALGLAYFNNHHVHRAPETLGSVLGLRRFSLRVLAESLIVILVLMAASVLVQTPPPLTAAEKNPPPNEVRPFSASIDSEGLGMHFIVTPSRVGDNHVLLHLYTTDGEPVGDVQLVRLSLDPPGSDIGQSSVDLEPQGTDTYTARGGFLGQSGEWQASLYVRRRGLDDTLVAIALPVEPAVAASDPSSLGRSPIEGVPSGFLVAACLLLAAVIPWLWSPLFARVGPGFKRWWPALGGLLAVTAVIVFGWTAARASQSSVEPDGAARSNPLPRTNRILSAGQQLYQEQCLLCHGPTGRGDGPVGRALSPPPADLQVHMIPGVHDDAQIFEWIELGYPDSQMPAFGEHLTADDIWSLVHFIRTFAPEGE